MTVSRSRKPSQSRGGEIGPLRAVLFRHVGGIADAVVLSKVWCVLVRFARWLGFSHLLYPIDGAHAHRAVQTRQGNKADSSVGTFVHTIHQPRVAPSTRAPWPPRYERFPPPRCLIWSAWFARSYRWQGKPHGNPTDHYSPVHTISTLPLGTAHSATTRPMALPADVSACALDTRRRTTILLGRSLAAEFPMSTRYLCRDSRSGSGTTSAPIPNTHTARSDAQKYHNPGARGLPPRSIGGDELSPRLRTCQAVCGGE